MIHNFSLSYEKFLGVCLLQQGTIYFAIGRINKAGLSFGSAFRQFAELFTEMPNFLWRVGRVAEHPISKLAPLDSSVMAQRIAVTCRQPQP